MSQEYPFINYKANHLLYSNDSSNFMHLFKKISELKKTKNACVNIVHVGGSHVQGGMWTNTFYTLLQQNFKLNGGGYFTFPYRLAKTNSQPYSTSFSNGKWKKCRCITKDFCLPLGMSGISVTTNDSFCNFGVALTKKSVLSNFNTIKVYHNFNESFEFDIRNTKIQQRIDKKENGYTTFILKDMCDSVVFELKRKDTITKGFTLFGFSLENNNENGFYLAGLGVNGASSNSFLRCNKFEEQLKTIMPDLVILSLGVNDSQAKNFNKADYIAHYDSLIKIFKTINPKVAILLTTTTDNFIKRRSPNKRTSLAQDAMFSLMQKNNVAVWDLYEFMGGYKSMLKWVKAGLAARDRVHFTPKGYTIIGTNMFNTIYSSYKNNTKN
ncbi:MAG: hypothetical protein JSU07_09175 [Bacteroidetes bacterium]|nr:hypothetical protein [Bacteroidota bacterium]